MVKEPSCFKALITLDVAIFIRVTMALEYVLEWAATFNGNARVG